MEFCWKNNPDSFGCVFGVFDPQKQRQKISSTMREGYEIYFQIKPENGEKYWIPNSCCSTFAISLRSVYREDFNHFFRFMTPTFWREPQNYIDNRYFCLTDFKGYSSKCKDSITQVCK